MDRELKMVKVRRVKEKKEETKLIKVRRIQTPEDIKRMNKIKINSFKSQYERFLKRVGTVDEPYIENSVNNIACLYFYMNNMDIDRKELKEKLDDIDVDGFMKLYKETRLIDKPFTDKMNEGAVLLYNILDTAINYKGIEIKLPYKLPKLSSLLYYSSSSRIYKKEIVKRVYIMKDDNLVATFKSVNEIDLPAYALKNSNILIEYAKCNYVSIPYKYYEKVSKIRRLNISFNVIMDNVNGIYSKGFVDSDEYKGMTLEEIEEKTGISLDCYPYSLYEDSIERMIITIKKYSEINRSIDNINDAVGMGLSIGRELIEVKLKSDKTIVFYSLYDFLKKYLPFLLEY